MEKNFEIEIVKLRDVVIGEGRPKVCVSIMGRTSEDVINEALKVKMLPCDVMEWRVDYLEAGNDVNAVSSVLPKLREAIGNTPLIFTIRTSTEGGERSYTLEEYKTINMAAIRSGYVDMVDVELCIGDEVVTALIDTAHEVGRYVIASNHDFRKTPSKSEIVERLMMMEEKGADVLKVAVMPQNQKDVLTLLGATREVSEERTRKPIVTISMSELGLISRVVGESFGSAMTFAAGSVASAPGQIPVDDLVVMLDTLHHQELDIIAQLEEQNAPYKKAWDRRLSYRVHYDSYENIVIL